MTTWTLPLASASLPLVPYSSTPFQVGAAWTVSEGGLYLAGYQCSVPAGGDTGPQPFRCWQLCDNSHSLTSVEVTDGRVTSGTLTAAAVNTVMLGTAVPLGQGLAYVADTYWTPVQGFPDLQNQFGNGQPLGGGATAGPATAYTDRSGALPVPFTSNLPMGLFGTSSSVPPPMPTTGSNSSNFGISVIITDQAPPGASYVLWPSQPAPISWALDTADTFTLATQFALSQLCAVNAIRFFSPPGAPTLPDKAGIWDAATQQLVPGTLQTAPSWSGAAGSGWVESAYGSPPMLSAYALYKTSVFNSAGGSGPWNAETPDYWSSGPGGSGIGNGPVSAPGVSTAASPGQSTYHLGGSFSYPDTFNTPSAGANYWVDVRVTPASAPASGGSLLLACFP